MERLTLPEPGRTLWASVYDTLRQTFPGQPHQPGFALTGGTLLAARFAHRQSTDIDIKVMSQSGLEALAPHTGAGTILDKAMRAHGGNLVAAFDNQRVYRFDNGTVDISAGPLFPIDSPKVASVDGLSAQVADNAQIMAMKTYYRGARAPVRDVIDLLVTSELDPDAARLAVNILPAPQLSAFHADMLSRDKEFAALARKDARLNLEAQWEHCLDTPGLLAACVVEGLAARKVSVSFDPRGAQLSVHNLGKIVEHPPTRDLDELTGLRILHGAWPREAPAAQIEHHSQRASLVDALAGKRVEPMVVKTVQFPRDRERERDRARFGTCPSGDGNVMRLHHGDARTPERDRAAALNRAYLRCERYPQCKISRGLSSEERALLTREFNLRRHERAREHANKQDTDRRNR